MRLGTEDWRVEEREERSLRVWEMVVLGRAVRARINDSMAAMGGVRSGSEARRDL